MAIELRHIILDKSLHIENELSKILSYIIKIEKDGSKTLSNKSSSIPLKVKVDFLYDLKRITKEEYTLIILFMEIRNQVIHNIDINSMEKALEATDNKKRFLKLDQEAAIIYENTKDEQLKESVLVNLLNLHEIKIREILSRQIELIMNDLQVEQQNIANRSKVEIYDQFVEIFDETQYEVAEKVSEIFTRNEKDKEQFIKIFQAMFYKIFEDKIELKYEKPTLPN